ncbi:DUF3306 domain-containing protein [Vibrio rarus]|uniref:DUF3306 domain-containing protein n=1 Tax=Vibrio rarus TaxID=413403 RepID=UPI0021C44FC2|nr:DUF3306 domain-containing protein [Vibrio rarus]
MSRRGLFERLLHKHAVPVQDEELDPSDVQRDYATVPQGVKEGSTEACTDTQCSDPVDTKKEPLHEKIAEQDEPLESLDNDEESQQGSAMSALLASDAAPALKKRALRNLFFSGEFSEVDELNDYHQDFSQIKSLSADVTNTLRQWTCDKVEQLNELDEGQSPQTAVVTSDPAGSLAENSEQDEARDGQSALEQGPITQDLTKVTNDNDNHPVVNDLDDMKTTQHSEMRFYKEE